MHSWHAGSPFFVPPTAISRMTLGSIGGYRRFSNVGTQELCQLHRNKNLLYCSIAYVSAGTSGPNTTVSRIRQIGQSLWFSNNRRPRLSLAGERCNREALRNIVPCVRLGSSRSASTLRGGESVARSCCLASRTRTGAAINSPASTREFQ